MQNSPWMQIISLGTPCFFLNIYVSLLLIFTTSNIILHIIKKHETSFYTSSKSWNITSSKISSFWRISTLDLAQLHWWPHWSWSHPLLRGPPASAVWRRPDLGRWNGNKWKATVLKKELVWKFSSWNGYVIYIYMIYDININIYIWHIV